MASQGDRFDRRGFLGGSLKLSGAGMLAGLALEERALVARAGVQGTERPPDAPSASPVEGLPKGSLGKLKVSRLICGGNLFSGFDNSRQSTSWPTESIESGRDGAAGGVRRVELPFPVRRSP